MPYLWLPDAVEDVFDQIFCLPLNGAGEWVICGLRQGFPMRQKLR